MTGTPETPAQFTTEVVTLLVPLVTGSADRKALLNLTFGGVDEALLSRVNYEGSAQAFAVGLVRLLAGNTSAGEPSLTLLLRAIREQVGDDQQTRIDTLLPVVPFYARKIAAQVQRDRLIRQVVLAVGGIVVFFALIAAIGALFNATINRIIPSLTPLPPTPIETLSDCEIGIAVGYFGIPADGSVKEADAKALLDRVYGRLTNEIKQFGNNPQSPTLCARISPDKIGTVATEDKAREVAAVRKARIVLYGTIEQNDNKLVLRPRYFADPRTFAQAVEMGGAFRLGSPVPINDIASPTIEMNKEVSARITSITRVFAGLAFYVNEDYAQAKNEFTSALTDNWGDTGGTDTLNILIGNANLRLASVAAQKSDLENAENFLKDAFDAYHKAEANNQEAGKADYGRVNIALASATYVQWILEYQKPNSKADKSILDKARDSYAKKIEDATDTSYDDEVKFQGDFARLQIEYALWKYYNENNRDLIQRYSEKIINAYNNGKTYIGYLSAEAHWYLGLAAETNDAAIVELERATNPALGSSRLRQMFFWDSLGSAYNKRFDKNGPPGKDATKAWQEALKIAQELKLGQKILDGFNSKLKFGNTGELNG